MFPNQGLFSTIACPDHPRCKASPCLFSHSVPRASTSTLPQKRPATPSATLPPARKVVKSTPVASTSAPVASTSKPVPKPSNIVKKLNLVASTGPPRIVQTGATHTAFPTRSKMLTTIYTQFLATYSTLPDQTMAKSLAHRHALAQELAVYTRSNKMTYRNSIISTLARLKKRPLATSVEETGTLEDDIERAKKVEEEEKGRLTAERISQFVSSRETLLLYDYVVDIPSGEGGSAPTEEGNLRRCDRCGKDWRVRGGDLDESYRTACSYHFGRLVTERLGGEKTRVFSCCPGTNVSPCQTGPHVFRDDAATVLHSRVGFIPTSSLDSVKSQSTKKLFLVALDCEMVQTTAGLSLARLTVVDSYGEVVLDAHVKPPGTLLDTNLRFSGVKVENIEDATMDIRAVREELGRYIDEETVIVGHGLENDLKALRLIHPKVIDTAIIFPHPRGIPFRHALRNLTRDFLGKFIQDGDPSVGHSALDDSQCALELLRYKVKQLPPSRS